MDLCAPGMVQKRGRRSPRMQVVVRGRTPLDGVSAAFGAVDTPEYPCGPPEHAGAGTVAGTRVV